MSLENIKHRLKYSTDLSAEDYVADVLRLQRLGEVGPHSMPPTMAVAEGVRERLPKIKSNLFALLSNGEADTLEKVSVLREAEDLLAAACWSFEKTLAETFLEEVSTLVSEFHEENADLARVADKIRGDYLIREEDPIYRFWGCFIKQERPEPAIGPM